MLKVVENSLAINGKTYRCAVGKNGFSADKKEGDGCSPVGIFPLRELWYRADKMPVPKTNLPTKIITENDGWCDDVNSPDYNKHIKLVVTNPHAGFVQEYKFSHEKLWRDDGLYDLIIPLGYNDSPVIKGKGSAIFMHIAKPDYSGTEGCIALAKDELLEILTNISAQDPISIASVT